MDGPVLVTGAAGFIGSHVVAALLRAGRRVVGIDNFDPFYEREIKLRNLREAADAGAPFELVQADIVDDRAMADAATRVRPTTIVHLAARAGVRPSIADPIGYARVNVLGTASVLRAAGRAGCGRVLIASSSSVYGDAPSAPFREDDHGIMPISPYAATKRSCEMLAHAHWHLTGMPTACLRFFTVYGPRQRPDLAIGTFMSRIRSGEPIRMFGDGSSSRDYTYIDDIIAGILGAERTIDGLGFRVWNLGSDAPVRLDELIQRVASVVGRQAIVDRAPRQPGDVARTWADLSRARAEIQYAPHTPLDEGLARQWAWMTGGNAA